MRAVLLCLALLLTATAQAQTVKTERFVFFADPGLEQLTEHLAKTAEEDRTSIAVGDMGSDYPGETTVHVVASPKTFKAAVPAGAEVPDWAEGVAFPDENLVIVRVQPGGDSTRSILRHELSHIAVGRLTGKKVPRWFLEGLATIRAGDTWSREGRSLIMAGLSNDMIPLGALDASFPAHPSDAELAYAESAAFVQYLVDRSGEAALQDVLRRVVAGSTFEDAMIHVLGESPLHLENAWRRSLEKWVLAIDLLMSRDFFWMSLAFLVMFGAWRVRRARLSRLRVLEKEEQAEAARVLIRTPGLWADGPPPTPPAPAAETTTLELADSPPPPESGDRGPTAIPKKPTLH